MSTQQETTVAGDWVARLTAASTAARPLDLRVRSVSSDGSEARTTWGPEQTVPAAAIVEVLTSLEHGDGARPLRTLWLRGVRIEDTLDLEGMSISVPMLFEDCHFARRPVLRDAEIVSLRLARCRLSGGVEGKGLCARGDVALWPDVRSRDTVSLDGARVGGNLLLAGRFTTRKRFAIRAEGIVVDGGAIFTDEVRTQGEVSLTGARIAGDLDLGSGHLSSPGGSALRAERIVVQGDVYCRPGFRATGQVRLVGAHITGELRLSGGRFTNVGGIAVHADGLVIEDSVTCARGFVARGEVRLIGARIGSDLELTGGHFLNPGDDALSADRASVRGGVFCRTGFLVEGVMRLPHARVGSMLELKDGRLDHSEGVALMGNHLLVENDVLCDADFVIHGRVQLNSARIGDELNILGSVHTAPKKLAIDLENATVARTLMLRPAESLGGWVDLTNARVGQLADDADAWTGGSELKGLRYGALEDEAEAPSRRPWQRDRALSRRLAWLRDNRSGYHPQIYEQLAAHYRASGHEARQRTVLIHKQRRRRRDVGLPARTWSIVEDVLVGYGYRTWQALVPWIAAVAAGALFFHDHRDEIVQRNPLQDPPAFHSLTYTLDLLLPVVNLGQRDNWVALHGAQTLATILVLAGWILTTAILAALTGLVRRTN